MAKNAPKTGHSVRNGNAPSPYTKRQKKPYRYPWQKGGHKEEALDARR